MKKKLTTIIAVILCAIITVTSFGTDTAYAASKTPLKINFKGESITLTKDIYTKAATAKVKTLTKKWGKPEKEVYEADDIWDGCAIYSWKKGKTEIKYTLPFGEDFGSNTKNIQIYSGDKNVKVLGIKVGMKQAKAQKILEDLGGETSYSSTDLNLFEKTGIRLTCSYEDGKVSGVSGRFELK